MTATYPLAYPMKVTVIVDGNRHRSENVLHKPELPHIDNIIATILDEPPTLKRCQDLVNKLYEHYGPGKIKTLSIHLMDSDWFFEHMKQDRPAQEYNEIDALSKTAKYDATKNCLTIWQQDLPIYENNNGTITTDSEALADCLL